MVMFVSVRAGLTPVQFGLGQPAAAPETVSGAVRTAGLVVKLTVPFLIWSAGIVVGAVPVPVMVQTGEPPLLKCGLEAMAVEAVIPNAVSTTVRQISNRRKIFHLAWLVVSKNDPRRPVARAQLPFPGYSPPFARVPLRRHSPAALAAAHESTRNAPTRLATNVRTGAMPNPSP